MVEVIHSPHFGTGDTHSLDFGTKSEDDTGTDRMIGDLILGASGRSTRILWIVGNVPTTIKHSNSIEHWLETMRSKRDGKNEKNTSSFEINAKLCPSSMPCHAMPGWGSLRQ
jgi:hypothetical protein